MIFINDAAAKEGYKPPLKGAVEMEYENGMQIIWDVITREIVVIFRGTVTSLPGKFTDRQSGIEAGELICRNVGWGEPEFPIRA